MSVSYHAVITRFLHSASANEFAAFPDQTRMVVDEDAGGFGFTKDNELTNGRAAMMGFVLLLINEVVTGKGLLAATGFLDFLYRSGLDGPLLK